MSNTASRELESEPGGEGSLGRKGSRRLTSTTGAARSLDWPGGSAHRHPLRILYGLILPCSWRAEGVGRCTGCVFIEESRAADPAGPPLSPPNMPERELGSCLGLLAGRPTLTASIIVGSAQ